jgi:glycosyltransferase involved in cell wall biosynthesis
LGVALLSPCYWPEVRRGTERFTHELATGLLARGQEPTLITSHPRWPSRRVEEGLPVLRLPRPPQWPLSRAGFEDYLTHVPLSYLALRADSHDIAHAMYQADGLAAARWRARTGGRAVLSYMGIPDAGWLRSARWREAVTRRAVAGCDAVVALSNHAARHFRISLGREARVIPPGVDLTVFKRLAARSDRPTIVCSAAPEVERKNVRLLLDAFGLIRRERPDARLVLSEPRNRTAASKALGTLNPPGVEWRNLDQTAELARAYSEAWVVALPSVNEAFGLVLVEALACGAPVVGYAHSAVPEIIDRPQIGRLFGTLKPEPLAEALLETFTLTDDPATDVACRARAAEFSVEHCVERYLALYRELLGVGSHDRPVDRPLRAQLPGGARFRAAGRPG